MASMALTKGGLTVTLDNLKQQVSENEKAIAQLVLMSMGRETYRTLKKFDPRWGEYWKEHRKGLETELYHLRNLGYAHETGKARSIYDIPDEGRELSDYVAITLKGRKYIQLRERHADDEALSEAVE